MEAPLRPPTDVPAPELVLPDTLDLTFEGFGEEAFAILDRLREAPHIEQYRKEKEGVRRALKAPFKRYRDDLVVNWVLPNRLAFETEKNVFSRLLKNDFGAGGCHHHLWMAFYRPGFRRLTDFQLVHSIDPDGFTVGLYVGDQARGPLQQAKERVAADPAAFRSLVQPLVASGAWEVVAYLASGPEPLDLSDQDAVRDGLARAKGLWLRTVFAREDVLAWGGGLVARALRAVVDVWPAYRFVAGPAR